MLDQSGWVIDDHTRTCKRHGVKECYACHMTCWPDVAVRTKQEVAAAMAQNRKEEPGQLSRLSKDLMAKATAAAVQHAIGEMKLTMQTPGILTMQTPGMAVRQTESTKPRACWRCGTVIVAGKVCAYCVRDLESNKHLNAADAAVIKAAMAENANKVPDPNQDVVMSQQLFDCVLLRVVSTDPVTDEHTHEIVQQPRAVLAKSPEAARKQVLDDYVVATTVEIADGKLTPEGAEERAKALLTGLTVWCRKY